MHPARLDVLVDADLLVDGGFIAGERHDLAQLLGTHQETIGVGIDADCRQPAFGGDEGRFGNTELGGDVALAQRLVRRAVGADLGRGRARTVGHRSSRYLFRINLPCRVIRIR